MQAAKTAWCGLTLFLMALLPSVGQAAVSGPCSDCHTMHASSDGTASTPEGYLLTGGCVSCHTGDLGGSAPSTPYVLGTSAPTDGAQGSRGILAGGNFWWVSTSNTSGTQAQRDAKGHNVYGISATDSNISGNNIPGADAEIPGGNTSYDAWNGNSGLLTCAGTYGCHGDRSKTDQYVAMKGTHHGSAMSSNYRLLQYYDNSATTGTTGGVEDDDWNWEISTDKNEYKGVARTNDNITDKTSISAFCASCHGNFHTDRGTNDATLGTAGDNDVWGSADAAWIRHPVDYDLTTATYAAYTYDGINDVAPTASTNPSSPDYKIIMCLTCHRAHGSSFADLLRWDMSTCTVGADTRNASSTSRCGCFACHSDKGTF